MIRKSTFWASILTGAQKVGGGASVLPSFGSAVHLLVFILAPPPPALFGFALFAIFGPPISPAGPKKYDFAPQARIFGLQICPAGPKFFCPKMAASKWLGG